MRFVAGRGAVAERLQRGRAVAELMAGSDMAKRMAALWQRAIGKMLLAGAPQWQSCWQAGAPWESCWPGHRGELLEGAPWQSCWPTAAGRHYDTKKESDP